MTRKNEMSLFKVSIISNYKNMLLNYLSNIDLIHIKSRYGEAGRNLERKDRLVKFINDLRKDLDELFQKLEISEYTFQSLRVDDFKKYKIEIGNTEELINQTFEEINFYTQRINELERYIIKAVLKNESLQLIKECYEFLKKFKISRFSSNIFHELSFQVFTTYSKNYDYLKDLLEFSEFPNFHQTKSISGDRILFFIIYPNDLEEDLQERIDLIHAEELQVLNKYLTYDGINFIRIDKEIANIEKHLKKYRKELDRIRNNNLHKFAALNEIVTNIEFYNWAEHQFEEVSSNRLRIQFFIPTVRALDLKQKLENRFKNKINVDSIHIPKKKLKCDNKKVKTKREQEGFEENDDLKDETPTIMKNPFFIRPFEVITKMYGTPSYSEVDPTPFIAITFPLIFGLMFGDIGHGICLVIAGLIGAIMYRKREGNLRNFCWIIFYCGWGAIFGGYLYGEFFGTHEIFGIPINPIRIGIFTLHKPIGNIMVLFIFVIIIGVIHINLGWCIQFVNYWNQRRKYLSFTDSLLKMLLLTGGVVLILGYGLDIAAWLSPPFPILFPLIPGILLYLSKPLGKLLGISYFQEKSLTELIGEGSMEMFETGLSMLSNIISYVRILALALVHIALMMSIEAMIGLIEGEGIFIQVLIILGLILGNLIVILLEGLLVFINTIRLHFYEFFFKFYVGEGIDFLPFFLVNDFSNIIFKIDHETDVISEEIEKEINIEVVTENINRAIGYISGKYL